MSNDNDRVVSGLICEKDLKKIKEAVCIQVEKVYDSCKEKDCIEDARVLFKNTEKMQWLINNAINVKCRQAEVVDVFTDVEPVPFKRGFYTVDVKFFIKVLLDFFVPSQNNNVKIISVAGLVVFDKKVILFGSEGKVKIFKSHFVERDLDKPTCALQQDNLPISKVEVAEPICLNARIAEIVEKCWDKCCMDQLPRNIVDSLGDDDFDEGDLAGVAGGDRHIIEQRVVLASIGLFSIIKLVRFVQLLIPAFDFCVPNKKCIASTDQDPCEIFDTIDFPVDEFFPPQKSDFPRAEEEERELLDGQG